MGLLDALLEARGPLLQEAFAGELKRLADGTFAPKGSGSFLRAGDTVRVPHKDGSGKMLPGKVGVSPAKGKAKVTLDAGPDKGKPFDVHERAPGSTAKPAAPGASALDVQRGATHKRKLTEAELPKRVGTGAWTPAVADTVKGLSDGSIVDTEQAYRERLPDGSLGPYTPERAALHSRIATLLVRHAAEHPDGKARAVFLAGGPSSGKSSLLSTGNVSLPNDAVDVNPDIVRTMLPEYGKLIAAGDKQASAKSHEEASHLAKLVMNLALERQHHVTVDGVGGGSEGKFAGKIKAAQAAGHAAEVHYVSVPTDEAIVRAESRAKRSGRHVPVDYLRAAHREVSDRFEAEVQHIPNLKIGVYDNQGKAPVKIAGKSEAEAKMQVVNAKLYREFLAKARRAAGQKE